MKLILSSIFFLLSISSFAQNRSQVDYLAEAGLDLAYAKETFLNNQNCLSNINEFKACLYSMMILLEKYSDTPKILNHAKLINLTKEKNVGAIYSKMENGLEIRLLNERSFKKEDVKKSGRAHTDFIVNRIELWTQLLIKSKIEFDFESLLAFIQEDTDKIFQTDIDHELAASDNYIEMLPFISEPIAQKIRSNADFIMVTNYDRKRVLNQASLAKIAFDAYYVYLLKDHSRINSAEYLRQIFNDTSHKAMGTFGILGKMNKDHFFVREVDEGGPSDGILKPFDEITHVNGVATNDPNFKMGGNNGEIRDLTVRRGGNILSLQVILGTSQVNNVEYRLVSDGKTEIGYIKIKSFINFSNVMVEASIIDLQSRGAEAIVLDLRGNPGGYVDQAISIADLFLDEGLTVLTGEEWFPKKKVTEYKTKDPMTTDLPLVTLIDSSSASAAEILAGALADHGRTILVGKRSFGKGTMQTQDIDKAMLEGQVEVVRNIGRSYRPGVQGKRHARKSSYQLKGVDVHFEVDQIYPDRLKIIGDTPREDDLAIFPVAADGKSIKYKATSKIKKCLRKTGTAKDNFMKDGLFRSHDYQYLFAEDVATCLVDNQDKKISKVARFR